MNGGSRGGKIAVLSTSKRNATRRGESSGPESSGTGFDVPRARIAEASALHEPDADKGCRVGVVKVMFEYSGSLILGIASVCLSDTIAIIILKKSHEVHRVGERVGRVVSSDAFDEQVVDVWSTLAPAIRVGYAEVFAIRSWLA